MKRIVSFISVSFITCMLFSMLLVTSAHADPVQEISTCAELQDIPNTGSGTGSYVLTNDVDCTGIDFVPLMWEHVFLGTFDGQGHTIFNLTINKPSSQYVGLFEATGGGSILNLKLIGGSVTGDTWVGALVGSATNTSISNVHSSADVTGISNVGGLLGDLMADSANVSVANLSSSGEVSGVWDTGGLIGFAHAYYEDTSLTIERSFATGDVTGIHTDGNAVGGLIGRTGQGNPDDNAFLEVVDSFASGIVSAPDENNVGGLIGYTQAFGPNDGTGALSIENTYASGFVYGDQRVGALIGNGGMYNVAEQVFNLSYSLAVGNVTGSSDTGGLVGFANGSHHDIISTGNYWDESGTGQSTCMSGSAASSCNMTSAVGPDASYYWDFSNDPFTQNWTNGGDPWYEHSNTHPTLVDDDDFDGISNAIEDSGPNDGDGDNSSAPDSLESNVATGINAANGDYFTMIVDEDYTLIDVESVDPSQFENATYTFPFGMNSFKVLSEPGDDVQVVILLHSELPGDQGSPAAVKYNPHSQEFAEIEDADLETYEDFTVMIYTAEEGGMLDQDGTENGILVDPVGLGYAIPAAPVTTTVVPAPGTSGVSGTLPATGNDTGNELVFAMFVLLSGIALAVFSRKRLQKTSHL